MDAGLVYAPTLSPQLSAPQGIVLEEERGRKEGEGGEGGREKEGVREKEGRGREGEEGERWGGL